MANLSIVIELQDMCPVSSMEDVKAVFREELGQEMEDLVQSFDPVPVGSASLAQVDLYCFSKKNSNSYQVHRATLKDGVDVAIKIQHRSLERFAAIDMEVTAFAVHWIGRIFPEFQLTWLADEMKANLPKELDFRVEAANAARLRSYFANETSPLAVPKVLQATRRVLLMEFIRGARIDDIEYMVQHGISPTKVSRALTEIFQAMIFRYGFVHW